MCSLALLSSWGCHKKPSVPVPAGPPPVTAPVAEAIPEAVTPPPITREPAPLESAPIGQTISAPSNLEVGMLNFNAGNYILAARAFEAFLRNNPKSPHRDQALFYLGLSRALASDRTRDWREAEAALRRLINEYPDSIYKNQADFILGLQGQIDKLRADLKDRDDRIKKLSDELQVLKEIDLQRRPSRPKE